jgi:hypothetical protein
MLNASFDRSACCIETANPLIFREPQSLSRVVEGTEKRGEIMADFFVRAELVEAFLESFSGIIVAHQPRFEPV